MKRLLLVLALLCGALSAGAQTTLEGYDRNGNQIDPSRQPESLTDSTKEVVSLPPKLFMWKISRTLGNKTLVPVDTLLLNFQNTNMADGMTGHYNYLGNLGSPRYSRLFFEQEGALARNMFLAPLNQFYFEPDDFHFTNSNIPYANLTYYKAGDKVTGEERFKAYFSVNANKRTAFGFNFDYLYGRGKYSYQSTSYFNGGVFGSYNGEHYQIHAMYNHFFTKMNENGGIDDDRYITRPEDMAGGKKSYESNTIPVTLESTTNRNRRGSFYLTHRYCVGFHRETVQIVDKKQEDDMPAKGRPTRSPIRGAGEERIDMTPAGGGEQTTPPPGEMLPDSAMMTPKVLKDTIRTREFIPVTSFIHTVDIQRFTHRFRPATRAACWATFTRTPSWTRRRATTPRGRSALRTRWA